MIEDGNKIVVNGNEGISIEDVRTVLGESSTDLGTLCQSSAINKFAKCKPIRYNKVGELTDDERRLQNYGLTLTEDNIRTAGAPLEDWTTVQEVAADLDWDYLQPRGSEVTPYEHFRLHDFKDYYHEAAPFLQVDLNTDSSYSINIADLSVNHAFVIPLALDPDNSQYTIQSTDLYKYDGETVTDSFIDLSEWTALAIVCGSNNFVRAYTPLLDGRPAELLDGDGQIQGDTITINLNTGNGYTYSTYNVYVCLYKVVDGNYVYIPLPKQTISETEHYNKMPFTLRVVINAVDGGGGIKSDDPMGDSSIAPTHGGTAISLTDLDSSNTYVLGTSGEFHLIIPFTNGSTSSSTFSKNDFTMYQSGDESIHEHPTQMWFNGEEVSSFTIEPDASAVIPLELRFDTVLNLSPNDTSVVGRELTLRRNGNVDIIDNFSINCKYNATPTWIEQ